MYGGLALPAADAQVARRHTAFTVAAAAGEQADGSRKQDQRIETSERIK